MDNIHLYDDQASLDDMPLAHLDRAFEVGDLRSVTVVSKSPSSHLEALIASINGVKTLSLWDI